MSELEIENIEFAVAYNGKWCSLKNKYKKKGVYLIKENGVLVYIGMSGSCVKKALYRHFQIWNDRRWEYYPSEHQYERVVYDRNEYKYEVAIIESEDAANLEKKLILKYNPRDNARKYYSYLLDKDGNLYKINNYSYGGYNDDNDLPF